MKLYFDHEHYEYLTESELLASYHQLRRENHTETEDYFDCDAITRAERE